MLNLKVRREDAEGPYMEIGLIGGQYNIAFNREQKILRVTVAGAGAQGSATGKFEVGGDDFDKLMQLIDQGNMVALANKQEAADG